MRLAERTFPPASRSVAAARRFVSETLATWSADGLAWASQQIVSELATNAVLHAASPFTVALGLSDGVLRIEVGDESARAPRQRHYSDEATTGRGLSLVASIARAWGVTQGASGKRVWCELVSEGERADAEIDLDSFLTADDSDLADPPASRNGPSQETSLRRVA